MSHFTVLVIGDDYEGQLAPFDEDIRVPPYRSYEKDPEWLYNFFAERNEGEERPSPEALVAFLNKEWGPDEKYGVDEKGIYSMSRYNPISKWDWYTVGGRWTGYFKLTQAAMDRATTAKLGRPGVFDNEPTYDADVVLRGDVDAEAMRDLRGEAAGKRWDRAQEIFADTPVPETWEVIRERHGRENADAARAEYGEQPRVAAVREHDNECRKEERHEDALLGWDGGVEEFSVSREVYVQLARDRAITPYAYLYEGEWHAPGQMGWFGMSSDTQAESVDFAREFNEFFDSLPPDTILTLVDCHI